GNLCIEDLGRWSIDTIRQEVTWPARARCLPLCIDRVFALPFSPYVALMAPVLLFFTREAKIAICCVKWASRQSPAPFRSGHPLPHRCYKCRNLRAPYQGSAGLGVCINCSISSLGILSSRHT